RIKITVQGCARSVKYTRAPASSSSPPARSEALCGQSSAREAGIRCGFVTLLGSVEPIADRLVPSGSDAHSDTPCLESLGAGTTLRCRRDKVATDVESVVDRSPHRSSDCDHH